MTRFKCKTALLIFFITLSIHSFGQTSSNTGTGLKQLIQQADDLYESKNWAAAIAKLEKLVALNPVHIDFCYELADSYYQSGNYNSALSAFQKCDSLTGGKSYWESYNLAKTYARIGNQDLALQWAIHAFDLGLPRREAFGDPAFNSLKSSREFQRISGTTDISKLNRNEGWRFDLHFLGDEIKRKAYRVHRDFSQESLSAEIKRIEGAIPQLSDMQMTVEFIKLLVKVGDGHSMLYAFRDNPEVRKCIPVDFFWFKEGMYVVQADKRYENLLGAKLLSIENKTPEEVITALKPLLNGDNNVTLKVLGMMRIRHTAILHAIGIASSPDSLHVKFMDRKGKEVVVTLPGDSEFPTRRLWDGLPENWVSLENSISPMPLYLRNRYSPYWFDYLKNEKTVWFQYNRVLNDDKQPWRVFLDSLFNFIDKNNVERLVIDMRNNNGGNGELSFPLIHKLIRCEKLNKKGKLFVVTGRKTFSAAGICISLLERHTNAIFAGEPAGTSPNFTGEEFEFELPYSHLWGNVSDREHHYARAVDFRTWIPPLIYVDPSFDDLIKGRDVVWKGILDYGK